MVDPLSQLRAQAMNRPAAPPGAQQVLPGSLPGQPGYNARIPPPDGPAMGEVDQAGVPLIAETPNPYMSLQQAVAGVPPPSPRRVVVYCGRGDDFVVSVEESAEDEALYSKRYDLATLMPILDVVRALGIKILDRTGGELQSSEITLRSGRNQGPTRTPTNSSGGEGERSDWSTVPLHQSAESTG